jgi:hypothetical protein
MANKQEGLFDATGLPANANNGFRRVIDGVPSLDNAIDISSRWGFQTKPPARGLRAPNRGPHVPPGERGN